MWRASFPVESCGLRLGRKVTRILPERVAGQVVARGVARLYAQFALDKLLLEARHS
jgi:hypothetical protein